MEQSIEPMEHPAESAVGELASVLRRARRTIAFTGAGISTESGISDFRSPGGLWSRMKPVLYDDFLRDRAERVRYWTMRNELYAETRGARPNAGHLALAELERRGLLYAVITQNIDGLHQDAGSRRVLELHGTNRVVACVSCGREWPPDAVLARIAAGDPAPDCESCGKPLKSRTISFGQPLPPVVLQESFQLARWCEVCLAIGSSLVVEPAASIPRAAVESGARLFIINREPTPLDHLADAVVPEPIGAFLTLLMKAIE